MSVAFAAAAAVQDGGELEEVESQLLQRLLRLEKDLEKDALLVKGKKPFLLLLSSHFLCLILLYSLCTTPVQPTNLTNTSSARAGGDDALDAMLEAMNLGNNKNTNIL